MGTAEPNVPAPRPGRAWRQIGALVTVVSVGWVLFLLARVWPVLSDRLLEVDLAFLGLGMILLTISVYLNFEAFAALAGTMGISRMPRRQLAHVYFIGQLLKHVPGRIWGVGYQAAAGSRSGSTGAWLLANLAHMLMATLFALWSVGVVLAAMRGALLGVLVMAAGAIVYASCWRYASSARVQTCIGKLPGRLGKALSECLANMASTTRSVRTRITLSYTVSLLLLYCAWAMFGLAYPSTGAMDGLRLCAIYMVAWFVGFVSLLTPSGLGVRELAFTWLAHGFALDVVAMMAILGRAALLLADLALGLLFAAFFPQERE